MSTRITIPQTFNQNKKRVNRVTEAQLANAQADQQYLAELDLRRQQFEQFKALERATAFRVTESNKKKKSPGKRMAKWLFASGSLPFVSLFGGGSKAAAASFDHLKIIIDLIT